MVNNIKPDYFSLYKWSILFIFWMQSVGCNQFGSRMRTEALAKSNIDGRIAAILNTGKELPEDYLTQIPKMDIEDIEAGSGHDSNAHTITKKQGMNSPKEEDNEQIPIIEVNASDIPIGIIFRTNSPKVNVEQQHKSAPAPPVQSTRTEEEPHRLMHEIYRPVFQELTEVIQPYRKVTQQINPVIEEVQQIISSAKHPRTQTGAKTLANSLTNSHSLDQASQPSNTMHQNMISNNLMPLGSSYFIKSVPRSENVGIPSKQKMIPNLEKSEPTMNSYSVKSQKKTLKSRNQNSFQNRYLDWIGMALDGSVHRLGVASPSADNMHILPNPSGDYELFEVRINPRQEIMGSRSRYS